MVESYSRVGLGLDSSGSKVRVANQCVLTVLSSKRFENCITMILNQL